MHVELAVCLPREARTASLVRAALTHTLGLFGVGEDDVDDIGLALSEACANVIAHARRCDDYEVRVRVEDDRCEISVRNAGEGFDASTLSAVMPDPLSARGRGVAIMRAVMDQVAFSSDPADGTIVNLFKQLQGPMVGRQSLRRRAGSGVTPRTEG